MAGLSDETLVAYVDGELEPDKAAEVEAALAQDEEARRTVRIFRESAAVVKGAFDEPLHRPIPDSLLRALQIPDATAGDVVDLATRRESHGRRRQWRFALPLAASVALAIGLGGGYRLSTILERGQSGSGEGVVRVEAGIDERTLGRALETTASHVSVAWRDTAAGREGAITPTSTFRDARGRFCREFDQAETLSGGKRFAFGIACRDTAGGWRLEVFVASSAVAPAVDASGDGGGYVPAAGDENGPLDAILEGLMVGPPMITEQEAALIAGGWR